jgi:hypothetical protein
MDTLAVDPRVSPDARWVPTDPFDADLPAPKAWMRGDIGPGDWTIPVPAACLREIAQAVAELRNHPVPTLLLTPADFAMPECRALMARVKAVLDDGIGFAVLDRLDAGAFDKAELQAAYWLLSQMIARPVAQAFKGTMLYDVTDTGLKTGPRVRGDVTSDELSWHTDYGFHLPPPYIGLLVLRTAMEGGRSSMGSLYTGHNAMRRRHPSLLRRLYRPFYWNRQGEHADGDAVCTYNPVFAVTGGQVRARFNKFLQPVGYRQMGQEIDAEGMEALNTLFAVMSEPDHHVSFDLAPGQIEFIANDRMCHSRTTFRDHDDPDRRRHLVRIFLRDQGRRSFMG